LAITGQSLQTTRPVSKMPVSKTAFWKPKLKNPINKEAAREKALCLLMSALGVVPTNPWDAADG